MTYKELGNTFALKHEGVQSVECLVLIVFNYYPNEKVLLIAESLIYWTEIPQGLLV